MVLNMLQNLGQWAKSKKKEFFVLPLDVRQMLGFALKNWCNWAIPNLYCQVLVNCPYFLEWDIFLSLHKIVSY